MHNWESMTIELRTKHSFYWPMLCSATKSLTLSSKTPVWVLKVPNKITSQRKGSSAVQRHNPVDWATYSSAARSAVLYFWHSLAGIAPGTCFAGLQQSIAKASGILTERQDILHGFPPKPLQVQHILNIFTKLCSASRFIQIRHSFLY